MKALAALALAALLTACQRLPHAQRGGTATATLTGLPPPATTASVTQPDNPAAATTQTLERTETRQEAAPLPAVRITETPTPAGIVRVTEQFGPPTILQHTVAEKTGTTIGPAQKDTAREIAAKLSSFAGIRWAGLGFLAFALGCFHPVVRAVVGGGKTIPALAAVAGVICIFGPALFVGHETLVLCLVAAGLAVAFLIVRLSHKEGQQDALATGATVIPFPPSSPPMPGG